MKTSGQKNKINNDNGMFKYGPFLFKPFKLARGIVHYSYYFVVIIIEFNYKINGQIS